MFQVGNKIEVVKADSDQKEYLGESGIITAVLPGGCIVHMLSNGDKETFFHEDIALVETEGIHVALSKEQISILVELLGSMSLGALKDFYANYVDNPKFTPEEAADATWPVFNILADIEESLD